MCGLCGLWGNVEHWSSATNRAAAGADGLNPLRERILQVRAVNRITRTVRVRVEDWAGSSWIVKNAFGATEIVDSLPQVWRSAEALTGRRVDPLSFAIIQQLEDERAAGHG